MNIIKKSLINSLLNSNKDIEVRNKLEKSNTKKILNNNSKVKNKTSVNELICESLTKNSLNNSKNKNKNKKEITSKSNQNENNNNESECLYIRNKHNHHLFSGFTKNEKKLIYRRKKNDDISSYNNKNKLSTNSSIKNIKIEKTKNFSSNNFFGYINNNLSNPNISYSIKNRPKYNYEEKQKIINKKNESIHLKETILRSLNKENNYEQDNEMAMNINKFEFKNEEIFNSNGSSNKIINKNNVYNNKDKPKSNNDNNSGFNRIESCHHKNKCSNSNNYMNKMKNKKIYDKFINLDKNMEKKKSDKNLSSAYLLNSPKNSSSNKKYLIKSDLRKKISKEDFEKPLTVRESSNINDINTKVIELLTNKINKIKQYMKESDKKNKESISHIFKKKKIESKNIFSIQKNEEVSENNTLLFSERARNNLINNKINNTLNNKNDISSEKKIKNIYINNNFINKKKNNPEKRKKLNNDEINKNINKSNGKNTKNYINHLRYNSNCDINGINYVSETNYNINFKQNKKKEINNKVMSKINTNYINNEEGNKNNNTKSYSLKVLPIKQINQNKIIVKGIKINGFEKLISKKYTTRNIDIPQYVTDRIKKLNGAASINNSNRYINTSNSYKSKFLQNKITGKPL